MKTILISTALLFLASIQKNEYAATTHSGQVMTDTIPSLLTGNFLDDYGIRYRINDSLWIQQPNTRYHIIKWNSKEQYLLARNDLKNHSDPGLYTRIDYIAFDNMKPYTWGFCLTVYNAKTDSLAELTAHADRANPKKGCGGFPFSRMKKIK
jgi:hypothetical protein